MTVNGVAARSTARELGRQRRRSAMGHVLARAAVYAVTCGAALVCAAPFLWGLVTAFEHAPATRGGGGGAIRVDRAPTAEHVRFLFSSTPFMTFVANTVIAGTLVVVVTLALALPAAYAVARLNRSWGTPAGVAILLVHLVPPTLLFLSLSQIVATLGLADSLWSLVLVYPTVTVPVSVWLLAGFCKTVPVEIEEQAMVDGHSRLGAFVRVVVPLMLPGVVAVAVLAFTLTAGEFAYALTFVWSSSSMPVSTGVPARLGHGDLVLWRSLQAGAVFVAVPIAFVCNLFLDRFVAGFTMGAVRK